MKLIKFYFKNLESANMTRLFLELKNDLATFTKGKWRKIKENIFFYLRNKKNSKNAETQRLR